MANIKETAKEYVSPETKNISELKKISVNLDIEEKTFTKQDGTDFSVKVFMVDDEEYRMPDSVLKQLKIQMEEKPDLEFFRVSKEGEGLNTKYFVIPL